MKTKLIRVVEVIEVFGPMGTSQWQPQTRYVEVPDDGPDEPLEPEYDAR